MSVQKGFSKLAFGDTIEVTAAADDGKLLCDITREWAEARGLPFITYHMVSTDGLPAPLATHFSTYPKDWVEYYIQSGLFFKDPVVFHAQRAVVPFAWHDLEVRGQLGSGKIVIDEASDAGIANGLSIPVRGPQDFAMFSVCPDGLNAQQASRLYAEMQGDLVLLAMTVHERARALLRPEILTGERTLSPREREVLQWVAAGKSSWDISQILNVSEHTVKWHIRETLKKLGCHDRTHAAVRAVILGLIEAPY